VPRYQFVDPLLRRQHVEELAEVTAEEAVPAEIQVAVEAAGLVLREQEQLPQPAVEAVGEGEVDDPVGAAERHRRLGPVAGERIEPRTLPAGEHHGHHVPHPVRVDVCGSHDGRRGKNGKRRTGRRRPRDATTRE
jgi:hypothetical protein